jgi:hypothetical protein
VSITKSRLKILNLINMKMTLVLETTQETMEAMAAAVMAGRVNELVKISKHSQSVIHIPSLENIKR